MGTFVHCVQDMNWVVKNPLTVASPQLKVASKLGFVYFHSCFGMKQGMGESISKGHDLLYVSSSSTCIPPPTMEELLLIFHQGNRK